MKKIIDALIIKDSDREQVMQQIDKETTKEFCVEMIEKVMKDIEKAGGKNSSFLTKLALIARYAFLFGYGNALADVQGAQELTLEAFAADQETPVKPPEAATNAKGEVTPV